MSKKIRYILLLLTTLGLGTFFQWKYCCTTCSENCHEKIKPQKDSSISKEVNGFNFSHDGVGYVCNQNFNFARNKYTPLLPIGDSVALGVRELKTFLEANPEQKAKITGFCTQDEDNTSALPNLGFARANNVKNYLVAQGITANRLSVDGKILKSWDNTQNDVLTGPINFEIYDGKSDDSAKTNWQSIKAKLNANPLQLNFSTGQTEIKLSDEQRNTIAELTKYLDNVSGAKLSVVGHTDNIGDHDVNVKLGLERAQFARDYLVKNGVLANQIEASSKGPDEPIGDNSQETGRAKNRRTVVLIK